MRILVIGLTVGAVIGWPLPTIDTIDQPSAIAVISQADLAETTVSDIASVLAQVPGVASYRYGDDPGGTATLDRGVAPAATPDLIGAMVLSSGTAGYRGLVSALESGSTQYQSLGDGLVESQDYLLFVATRDEPATPNGAGLATQIDFPIGFTDKTGWVAQPQFPGDTWQGAALVLSSQLTLDGQFQANLIDVSQGFGPLPFDGLFATGPDWAVAAVDWDTLAAYSSQPVSWGFASHVHDGSYGSCGGCASIVTAYPAVPRSSLDLYPLIATAIALDEPLPEATPTPAAEPSGLFPWLPLVIIGIIVLVLVLVIALVFMLLARRKTASVCDREKRAWDDAKRRLETAREFLESQYAAFNDRMARVGELETQLAEYERALAGPTAGSGGTEFARLDGELITVEGLKELIAHLQSDLADARSEANREKAELDTRLARFTEAEAEEAAARAAYEACIAASAAAAEAASGAGDGTATPEPTSPSGPSAPGVVVTPPVSSTPRADCGCDPSAPSPVAVPVGAAQRFRLFRDFDVISHVDEASQHGADILGADMVTGLKDAGVTMTAIGNAFSGRGAAVGGAKSFGSFQSGQFVKGSLQAVKGTVDGLGAMDVIPNVPTSLPEAVAQGLAATANLGAFVADKVTEWMGKNTLITVHASYYFQTVTIQPTQIWACEDSVWKCKTKVNVYTVGTLERERGRDQSFTVKSEPERRTLRAHLATLASRGRLRITNSVAQIAAWEAANPTGNCP